MGQQVHEKKPNITHHQGNANQDLNELSFHTCQKGCYQKRQQISVTRNVKKREHLCIDGKNVNWCSHCGKQCGHFSEN